MYVILCIDDNANNLFTLKTLLEQLDGIEVITALSAEEGLATLLHQSIDLIFLDVQMPEMDGFEAAKLIKSNRSTAGIPIVFITAIFKSDEFKSRGYDVGAVEYISKPIDDHQLLNKVRLYMRLNESEKRLIEKNRELKFNQRYLENVFEVTPNILITTDGDDTETANSAMLEFTGFNTLEDFKREHKCICDLFLEGDGWLQPTMEGMSWLEYILSNPLKLHRVSMMHNSRQHHFVVWAKRISLDENHRSVVTFTDITELEKAHQALREKEEIMIAQSRHAAMGEMIGMIGHQWRQPITVITMGANNMLAD
ncbi:MAG: response regulator, partial [Campylobacterota bacterium]|nr:response regulator [Campylobacterota bacterium]